MDTLFQFCTLPGRKKKYYFHLHTLEIFHIISLFQEMLEPMGRRFCIIPFTNINVVLSQQNYKIQDIGKNFLFNSKKNKFFW